MMTTPMTTTDATISQREADFHPHRSPTLSIAIPPPGARPSHFRRSFILEIKGAIQRALRAGAIDSAIAEECWRALPSFLERGRVQARRS